MSSNKYREMDVTAPSEYAMWGEKKHKGEEEEGEGKRKREERKGEKGRRKKEKGGGVGLSMRDILEL